MICVKFSVFQQRQLKSYQKRYINLEKVILKTHILSALQQITIEQSQNFPLMRVLKSLKNVSHLRVVKGRFSTEKSSFSNEPSAVRQKLITSSLEYVPTYGWNDKPIHMACSVMDLSPAAHRIITPYDLVTYSMKSWAVESLRQIDDTNFEGKKRISQKVEYAIRTRLSKQIPFLDTWSEAMALGARPSNIVQTKDILWDFSSEVWYRCGDKSTDYNYYTKRTLFNAAYASTELFMLTDKSPGYDATWQFLRRRLDDILSVGKLTGDLVTVLSHAGNGVSNLLTMFQTPEVYENPMPKYSQTQGSNQHSQQNNQPQMKFEQFESADSKTNATEKADEPLQSGNPKRP